MAAIAERFILRLSTSTESKTVSDLVQFAIRRFDGYTSAYPQRTVLTPKRILYNHDRFLNSGYRITRNQVYEIVTGYAQKLSMHNPRAHVNEKFTPHCCRVLFTTHLRRAGMSRLFIQELRGDSRNESIDIYDRIESDELKTAYLKHIPQLRIKLSFKTKLKPG